MSPTGPTFFTLNNQLTKAHRRIRDLEARETELLARNKLLCAVIDELTDDDCQRQAANVTASSDNCGEGRLNIGDAIERACHRIGPTGPSTKPAANSTSAGAPATGTTRAKTRRFPYV
jgi:hypothetical protein